MVQSATSFPAPELRPSQVIKNILSPSAIAVAVHATDILSLKRYRNDFGQLPNVIFPKTFNEKVQARKIFDRRKILTIWADKVAVRDYVKHRIGNDLLPALYHVTDDPTTIPFAALPDRYVVKASHGSGWVRIVKDGAKLDQRALVAECRRWLSSSYFAEHQERVYRDIKPCILVEEFLDNGHGDVAEDLKFYVFDGKVRVIQIDVARFGTHRRNIYDRDWKLLPVRLTVQTYDGEIARPNLLNEMIQYAEALSGNIDFVRVDLYQASVGIRFGEMTPSSGNGLNKFEPKSFDRVMGQYWKQRFFRPFTWCDAAPSS